MSLDVYLVMQKLQHVPKSSGIFIRRDGKTEEISQQEWNDLYPDRQSVVVADSGEEDFSREVYSGNITHNLGNMADNAGLYEAMWRPDEKGWKRARDLIEPLRDGLATLQSDPGRFKKLNPENGWGTYEVLIDFTADYLAACQAHPDADVVVWR